MWVNDLDFVDVTSGVARHLKVKRVLPTIKKNGATSQGFNLVTKVFWWKKER